MVGMMEPKILIGQILGFIAPIITFVSYQVNSKKKLLILQTAATLTTCLSYLLLGASSGFALNIVCIIRNVAFFFQDSKSRMNMISACILAAVMGGLGFLSWEGPISLLVIFALAANTIFMSFGDAQLLRKSVICTSSMILIYNFCIPNPTIGGIINESVAIVASIIGIIAFVKMKKEKTK